MVNTLCGTTMAMSGGQPPTVKVAAEAAQPGWGGRRHRGNAELVARVRGQAVLRHQLMSNFHRCRRVQPL